MTSHPSPKTLGYHIKEDGKGGEKWEMNKESKSERLKGRDNMENLIVDGKIILNKIEYKISMVSVVSTTLTWP